MGHDSTGYLQHTATSDARENLTLLREQWHSNAGYREYVYLLRKWDSKDSIDDTGGMPNESTDHIKRRPRWASALMTAALDMLSYLYAQSPVRNASHENRWREALWNFRYQENLNSLMRGIDRSTRRDGTVLGIAGLGSSETPGDFMRPADANGVDLFLRTRDTFEVLEHPDDPRVVGAALVWWGDAEQKLETGVTIDSEAFRYYDTSISAETFDVGGLSNSVNHNMGMCPALTYRNCYPDGLRAGFEPALMGPSVGGQDVVEILRTLNKYGEQLVWAGILSRGNIAVSGKAEADLGMAPDFFIGVNEVGAAWSLPSGSDLKGMIDVFQAQLVLFSISMGLPSNSFVIVPGSGPQSAAVILAQGLALTRDRTMRESVARVWEVDTSRVAAAANNTIPKAVQLQPIKGITYIDSPQALTHAEKLAEVKLKHDLALAGKKELKRLLDSHLTDKELDDFLETAAKDAEAATGLIAKRAGHLQDTREDGQNANDEPPKEEDDQ